MNLIKNSHQRFNDKLYVVTVLENLAIQAVDKHDLLFMCNNLILRL